MADTISVNGVTVTVGAASVEAAANGLRLIVPLTVAPVVPPPPVEPPPVPVGPVFGPIVESNLTSTGVTLTIPTDQPCQMQVFYGPASGTTYPSSTAKEQSLTWATHVQTISGIAPGTKIYYRAVATNQAGVSTTSAEGDFTTTGTVTPPPVTPPPSGKYPPDTTGLTYVPTPATSMPGYLFPVTDLSTGQRITRITNSAGLRHRYSSKASWNADQSLLLLDTSSRAMLNGTTYASLYTGFSAGDYFCWDATVPSRGWSGGGGNTFRRMTLTPSGVSVAQSWTFSQYVEFNYAGGQGSPSNDGRFHAFMWRKSSNAVGVGVFDAVAGSVISEIQLGSGSSAQSVIDSVCMSPSGDYVFVQGASVGSGVTQGSWIYHRDLSPATRRFLTISTSHYDAGSLADGTDALVMTEQLSGGGTGSGSWVNTGRWVMSSGAWALTGARNYVYSHVSTRNTARPGWAYLSNYAPSGTFPGRDEIVAVKLDGSDTVERFCHSHTNSESYGIQTHGCASPDGARVIFCSAWYGTNGYAFVTEAS